MAYRHQRQLQEWARQNGIGPNGEDLFGVKPDEYQGARCLADLLRGLSCIQQVALLLEVAGEQRNIAADILSHHRTSNWRITDRAKRTLRTIYARGAVRDDSTCACEPPCPYLPLIRAAERVLCHEDVASKLILRYFALELAELLSALRRTRGNINPQEFPILWRKPNADETFYIFDHIVDRYDLVLLSRLAADYPNLWSDDKLLSVVIPRSCGLPEYWRQNARMLSIEPVEESAMKLAKKLKGIKFREQPHSFMNLGIWLAECGLPENSFAKDSLIYTVRNREKSADKLREWHLDYYIRDSGLQRGFFLVNVACDHIESGRHGKHPFYALALVLQREQELVLMRRRGIDVSHLEERVSRLIVPLCQDLC